MYDEIKDIVINKPYNEFSENKENGKTWLFYEFEDKRISRDTAWRTIYTKPITDDEGQILLFILMYFSDCFMLLPKLKILFTFGNPVYLNDILPTAIATRSFNKILNYNANFSEISFELFSILAISLCYFAIGVFLFWRKHVTVSKK